MALHSRVLVADDDKDIADTTSDLFELAGHDVRVVYNGRQAVEAARSFKPRLVILDIVMPKMDGYEAALALRREQPAGTQLILVAHTGEVHPEAVERSRRAGFDYHLAKPATADRLLALADASVSEERLPGHLQPH